MIFRKTISGKLTLAIITATVIPSVVTITLLYNLLSAHDSMVRGHLSNISKNRSRIMDSYKSLLLEKKKRYKHESTIVISEFEKNISEGLSIHQSFKEIMDNYEEITQLALFNSWDKSSDNTWFMHENTSHISLPFAEITKDEGFNYNLRYIYINLPTSLGMLRIVLHTDETQLKDYKILAAIYSDNEQMLNIYRGIRKYYWRFFFLAILIIGVFSYLAAKPILRKMINRISILAMASRNVAKGDLDTRVPVSGGDEISELSIDFNNMITELNHYRNKSRYFERMGAWQEVARNLAHEIKNPLTPILLAVEQIQEKVPVQDKKFAGMVNTAVEIVKEEVETLRRLVEAFGSLARLPEKQSKPVVLNNFIMEIKELSALTWSNISIKFDISTTSELSIFGDPMLLKRAIMNVLENAVHATGNNKENTEISVITHHKDNKVFIKITDNGSGISDSEKIFEPYFTTKDKGTGLGLPLAKKIMLDIDGDLTAEMNEKKGTTFIFEFPLITK
ncbi:MAG: HAMP domain-containing histidine kinase [Deltaproteobacteria bacterium]|nr:HAMP domain-containing histidine kinase [Deltaproteobacteria bacterium]